MATFFIFSSVMIHPAIGFFHFVITLVFSLPLLEKEGYLKKVAGVCLWRFNPIGHRLNRFWA